MPVTASALPAIAFAKNEIKLEITSDDHLASAGAYAQARIEPSLIDEFDGEVRLKWAKGEVVMTGSDTPDDSGTQFLSGMSDPSYLASLVPYFQANYYIDRDFIVTASTTQLILTAREKGLAGNLTVTTPLAAISYTAGANEALKPDFKHMLQVWLKVSGTFKKVYDQPLQLDQPITGKTTKNIAPLLQPYLMPGYVNGFGSDKPSLTSSLWQACTKTLLEYYVVYAQFFGDNPTVKKLHKSSTVKVNAGGLDIQNAAVKTLSSFLRPDSGDDSKTLCLRQGSKIKKFQPEQPEFLYWLNLTGSTVVVKIQFDVFFNEGGTVQFFSDIQSFAPNTKYGIAVGYDQADIASHMPPGKTCAYYKAAIVSDAGTPLSVTYQFQADVYRPYPRYFVFQNSLGGYQTLYTWGKAQTETAISRQEYSSLATDREAATIGRSHEANLRLKEKQTVYTGYSSPRDIALLKDFFVSPEKYLVENGRYIPIALTTDSLKEAPDGDTLHGASFEFTPKYDEVVYTDDPSQQDNANTAYVPELQLIYRGPAAAIPTTGANVLEWLTSSAYANDTEFETGTTQRHFCFYLQADKDIVSVTDLDAVIGPDLTALFTYRNTIAVGGINYRGYCMVLGAPFSTSHTIKVTTT